MGRELSIVYNDEGNPRQTGASRWIARSSDCGQRCAPGSHPKRAQDV